MSCLKGMLQLTFTLEICDIWYLYPFILLDHVFMTSVATRINKCDDLTLRAHNI